MNALSKFASKHPQRGEIQQLLDMSAAAGWIVTWAHDGEEQIKNDDLETVLSVDQSALHVEQGAWGATLQLMLGEDPYGSVFDWSYNDNAPEGTYKSLEKLLSEYADKGEAKPFDQFMDQESDDATFMLIVSADNCSTANLDITADDLRARYADDDDDDLRTLETFIKHGACGSHMLMGDAIAVKRSFHANSYI